MMTYSEYMEKIRLIDDQMTDLKIEQSQKLNERHNTAMHQQREARAEYYGKQKLIELEKNSDCERIRREYRDKKYALHLQREEVVEEWRKQHPLPAKVVAKAYELLKEEGDEV